jgi:hypothetical protein
MVLGAHKAHGLCAAGEGIIMKVVVDVESVNMKSMSTIAEKKKAGKIIYGAMNPMIFFRLHHIFSNIIPPSQWNKVHAFY